MDKEKKTKEEAFSPDNRVEAVSRFAEALQREDIDGFMFGVSHSNGELSTGITGTKGALAVILSDIIPDLKLDMKTLFELVFMRVLIKTVGKEEEND